MKVEDGCRGGAVTLLGAHQRTALAEAGRRRRLSTRAERLERRRCPLCVNQRHLIVSRTAVDDVVVTWFVVGRRRREVVHFLQLAAADHRRSAVGAVAASGCRPGDEKGRVRLVAERPAAAARSRSTPEVGGHRRRAGVENG